MWLKSMGSNYLLKSDGGRNDPDQAKGTVSSATFSMIAEERESVIAPLLACFDLKYLSLIS